ncbi:hypothetical protein ABZP36_002566 [Zizania latifolia]
MSHLFLALLSALLLLSASAAAAESTLTQSRTLAGDQRLTSPGEIFQLGLFPAVNRSRWFLGIWFTVSPDTVVWVANRDRPFSSQSGVVAVSGRGALVLLDGASNDTVWSSNSSAAATPAQAQLLDTGNLVLTDKDGNILWQSFEHPTNTLLPGIRVGKDLRTGAEWSLSSWRSADDPSPGDFRYVMDTSGSPELKVWSKGRKTYRTGPWNGVRFGGIPEMTTFEDMFEFQFTVTAGEVSYMFRNRDRSPMSRVLLNESGVMQRMVWDRTARAWSNFWSGPRDQCDNYGRCGAFGVCNVVDATVCGCIRGFAPRSPAEWYMRNTSGGCARGTPLQCGGGGGDGNGDGFYALRGVKLPETHGCAVDAAATLEECGRRCLSNCSCTAYAGADIRGGGSGCIQWFGDLMDTRFVDGGQDLYVRVAKSELDAIKNTRNKLVLVISLVITGLVLLLLSLGFLIRRKSRRCKKFRFLDETGDFITGCPTCPLEIIRAATNNFSPDNKIGEGGFGIVYKGQLPDGQEVAVKKLSKENTVQGLKEFMNEVELIAKLQHRNLVRLLGCCIQCSERLLVYEYMSNKSLDKFIFDESRRTDLSWKTRMDIIIGVARGLVYLHEDSRHTMIHRDLKAANVLLDADMVAKISDFGIAKLFNSKGGRLDCTVTERIVGTLGYMSPEYAMDGRLSFMQDVYSFGVLLLEIISGRRNHLSSNLIAHTWMLWQEGRNLELLDPAVRGECTAGELEQAATCIQVGLLCVQESPDERPPMADVIHMLSREKAPGQPRRPVLCTPMMSARPVVIDLGAQETIAACGHSGRLTMTNLEGR